MYNYRPIKNFPFVSKVLERVVVGQQQISFSASRLLEPFQSGFRSGHSTETALLRVMHDVLVAADSVSFWFCKISVLHSIPSVTLYY